jgi:hypothetical protein
MNYTCKVKIADSEQAKTRVFVIDAMSYTEAEMRITQELEGEGEIVIDSIVRTKVSDILHSEYHDWYKAKVEIESDGKTFSSIVLIQANTIEKSLEMLLELYKDTTLFYSVVKLEKTSIEQVFEYEEEEVGV